MIRYAVLLGLVIVLAFGAGCNRPTQPKIMEKYVVSENAVGFTISPLPSENGCDRWLASYIAGGKTAQFVIEFSRVQTSDTSDKQFPIKFGKGRFVAHAGSDASVLLQDLKKALEAKNLPSKVKRSDVLPFTFANIGENVSQSSDGGFSMEPPGNWTTIKLFIGEDGKEEDEGEVFLNLNPAIKMAEFSIKDPDYGDALLANFAKVL